MEDPAEKETALRLLMAHMAGDRPWSFTPQMLASVCVIRLDTEELSCKVHL